MATATHMVKQTTLSILSVTAITLNLTFWLIPVFIIAIGQALARSQGTKAFWYRILDTIYHAAVHFNSAWVTRVLGVNIVVHGEVPRDPAEHLVVVSNHRSWFDILVLHALVTGEGPMIKFLMKKQLIYIPVVGWLCFALNFPRLNRGGSEDGRARDYDTVQQAAESLDGAPGALLSFAEGTRFSPAKQRARQSPYRYLLQPHSGGLRIILAAMPDVRILDCTLVYPDHSLSFWQCLGGDLHEIHVWIDSIPASEVTDVNAWLAERWQIKDRRIAEAQAAL